MINISTVKDQPSPPKFNPLLPNLQYWVYKQIDEFELDPVTSPTKHQNLDRIEYAHVKDPTHGH